MVFQEKRRIFAPYLKSLGMQENKDDIIYWYVLGSLSTHKELIIRDDLRHAGIESYVPLKNEVRRVRDIQRRKLVPAITGLIFAKASKSQLKEYCLRAPYQTFMRKSTFSRKSDYLTVADKAMENFMAATESTLSNMTYFAPSEITLHEGERVRVRVGTKEFEGEIMRIKGKRNKQLVVSIPEVAAVAITLTPDLIKVIDGEHHVAKTTPVVEHERNNERRRTKNTETDKKQLFETAYRLLFVIRDKYKHEAEYYLALNDLKRLRQRVAPLKGVLPSLEGELALALYLASVILDTEVEQAEERLKRAIEKLKHSSLLRLRMRFYLARLSEDDLLMDAVMSEIKSWSKKPLSAQQQEITKEINMVLSDKG